jgi:hypothetical protein
MIQNTDKDWEILAQNNPYWTVVTRHEFKHEIQNDPAAMESFLATGRKYVGTLFDIYYSALFTHLQKGEFKSVELMFLLPC